MATYTYQVDHGEESPEVGYGTIVNGGKWTAVCFDSQLSKNQMANELLDVIFDEHDVDEEIHEILIQIQRLI